MIGYDRKRRSAVATGGKLGVSRKTATSIT
jgi:hypothetical protein